MVTDQRLWVFLILLLYLAAGSLYATLTPAWQAPDEPAHYNYVRYLARAEGFPELVAGCYDQAYLTRLTSQAFPPELSLDPLCYEFHQPPLYYLLAAPVFVLGDGALVGLRFLSVLLGAGVIGLAYVIGRAIFPRQPALALGGMAATAFVPMHGAMLASANNDALAELLLAAILLLLVRRLLKSGPASLTADIGLGLLLGAGLLTKTTVYIAAPLTLAALLLAAWSQRRQVGLGYSLFRPAARIFGPALLLALPWYIRNLRLYGGFDLLGLQRHDAVVVGQLRAAALVAEVGLPTYLERLATTTFHSFWGQFGWMAVPMDGRTYHLLAALLLLAGTGLALWLLRQRRPAERVSAGQGQALVLLALTVLLAALGFGWYNLSFVQFQGRYLFPALIPLSLFFSLGLREIVDPRRQWWLTGGLILILAWLGLASWQAGGLDKWAVLILGLFLCLSAGRLALPRHERLLTGGLLLACYAGLAWLTLAAPFWFIAPYL